jgi:hypothetical protein
MPNNNSMLKTKENKINSCRDIKRKFKEYKTMVVNVVIVVVILFIIGVMVEDLS